MAMRRPAPPTAWPATCGCRARAARWRCRGPPRWGGGQRRHGRPHHSGSHGRYARRGAARRHGDARGRCELPAGRHLQHQSGGGPADRHHQRHQRRLRPDQRRRRRRRGGLPERQYAQVAGQPPVPGPLWPDLDRRQQSGARHVHAGQRFGSLHGRCGAGRPGRQRGERLERQDADQGRRRHAGAGRRQHLQRRHAHHGRHAGGRARRQSRRGRRRPGARGRRHAGDHGVVRHGARHHRDAVGRF